MADSEWRMVGPARLRVLAIRYRHSPFVQPTKTVEELP
jgi:hypothetical protein